MQSSEQSHWQYSCRTDAGRIRELNEDSCLCEPEQGLWVVADGMGGHSCGEVASALAIESVKRSVESDASLADAIQKAHEDILAAVDDGNGAEGMGTTVVSALSRGRNLNIAWVGDSRAYLWHPARGKLTRLTQDHSLVERLLSAGLITAEEAKSHPQRHLITQCLGSKDLEKVKVDQVELSWEPGQVLLLCSDGLTEELSDADMKTIFDAHTSLDKSADRLLRMALNKGGQDNISFILLQSPVKKPSGIKGFFYSVGLSVKRLFNR